MMLSPPLETTRLVLRCLQPADVGESYLSWLRDPEINRFLEIRFTGVKDLAELVAFVESVNASQDSLMLGIFLKSDGRHIGNIKLGPISRLHGRADVGYLIGDRASWGKGYASEAIAAMAHYGLYTLGIDKIMAGCYETNVGSAKALQRAGFKLEATIGSHIICEGKRVASLFYGMDRAPANADLTTRSPGKSHNL